MKQLDLSTNPLNFKVVTNEYRDQVVVDSD